MEKHCLATIMVHHCGYGLVWTKEGDQVQVPVRTKNEKNKKKIAYQKNNNNNNGPLR